MRLRSLLLALAVILLLAACAAPAAPAGAGPTKPSGERLTGTFNGNPALEGGCSWLDAGGTRYQLTLPRGYRVDYGQLTIVGPDGKPVAKAGDTIAVTGHKTHKTKERLSFCQVGPLFDVETINAGS